MGPRSVLGELHLLLEQPRQVKYAIRISRIIVQCDRQEAADAPNRTPNHKPIGEGVAKVEYHAGELYHRDRRSSSPIRITRV